MINTEIVNPSHDFIAFFARRIYPSKVTHKVIEQFTPLLKRSFTQYINDLVTERLKSALDKETEKQEDEEDKVKSEEPESKIVTTEEEREAYFIVKSILRESIEVERIVMKDNQTYCSINLDSNVRKPLIRLYFNGAKKYIAFLDEEKKEGKFGISSLDDIYEHSDKLKESLGIYL